MLLSAFCKIRCTVTKVESFRFADLAGTQHAFQTVANPCCLQLPVAATSRLLLLPQPLPVGLPLKRPS